MQLFADDTKLYREIHDLNDCKLLQDDLNSLSVWSDTWLLRFNAGKCVILKIRQKFNYRYSLNGTYLSEVNTQRDLGVLVSNDLSPRTHIVDIVKKANQRIGMVRRCFTNLTGKKIKTLYTTMIRPVLEYGASVWSPYYKKDIDCLEQVQKRCCLLTTDEIKLPSLEERRLVFDLCEVYKYLNRYNKIGGDELFTLAERQLGGHSMKLIRPYAKTITRYSFFSVRVVNKWNELPEDVVSAPTLAKFKEKLSVLFLDD